MTGKERLFAAIKGEAVDRPPIWLREGFNIGGDWMEEPMQDVLTRAGGQSIDFFLGWKDTPLYRELFDFVSRYADPMRSWNIDGYLNRYLVIPPKYIETVNKKADENTVIVDGRVETPYGPLRFQERLTRGLNTYWHVKPLVHSVDDLKKMFDIPFDFDPSVLTPYLEQYGAIRDSLGDRGILRIEYPSPIVAISAAMTLEDFLAMSITEKELFHRITQELTDRLLTITDALFSAMQAMYGGCDTIVNFGGAEQCTPPIMAPEAFDEYVVPYDSQIVAKIKSYGMPVNMHCHGKVKHALSAMKKIGVDSTDPVEPPPAGDVTYGEAREIAGDDLTLIGNLEFDELEYAAPARIRKRIQEIARYGPKRLILGASAGPISEVSRQLADNYRAWIEAALEYF